MIKELYIDALNGINTRENLSKLRQEIKNDDNMNELFELVDENIEGMCGLLSNDDPKVRKNAALLMGELDMSDFLEALVEGYKKETQLFVKSAYLDALKSFDYNEYIPFFKARVDELMTTELTDDNKKHISEEIKALTELIVAVEGITKHSFRGWKVPKEPLECILITNKLNKDVTEAQITGEDVEIIPYKAGVRFKSNNLRFLRDVRTYADVLFVIPDFKACEFDPENTAKSLAASGLIDVLERTHTGKVPFYFRIELKSNLDAEKKGKFIRRLSSELEYLTGRKLVNLPSDYEIEIRLIESKDNKLNALLKLYTIEDERFGYFKEHVSASIKPVNAALVCELGKEYMKENARVLDPFCGVGTMLIERHRMLAADTLYGLDINSDAIMKAKINTEAAGLIAHYINRDFFTFTHEYPFDEIITDMPFSLNSKVISEIELIYKKFFHYVGNVLSENGRVFMFSRNPLLAAKYAKQNGYIVLKECVISEKDDVRFFVFGK